MCVYSCACPLYYRSYCTLLWAGGSLASQVWGLSDACRRQGSVLQLRQPDPEQTKQTKLLLDSRHSTLDT